MKLYLGLVVFFALNLSSVIAQASTLKISGDSEFVAMGKPSAIKIHGQGSGLSGNLSVEGAKVFGEVSFPLSQFSTGVDLRDKHMKEKYLEVQKYPVAKLVISQLRLKKDPLSNGFKGEKIPFQGILTLHGASKPVSGTFDVATSQGSTKGEAQFEVKISDFGIQTPSYLGISVTDTVQITVHLRAQGA